MRTEDEMLEITGSPFIRKHSDFTTLGLSKELHNHKHLIDAVSRRCKCIASDWVIFESHFDIALDANR
jgi:hypothetical protein